MCAIHNVTVTYYYDITNRLIRFISDGGSEYCYEYYLNNNLTKLYQTASGSAWATEYTYDKDNRPVTVKVNGKTITDSYNATGTTASRVYGFSTPYTVALTYLAGVNGSKTGMLASYKNGSDTAYTYAYDDNGNLTSITRGGVSATYTYDSLNQLTRVNDGFTNKTTTYSYDLGGNILEKKEYAYTTGTLGTPTKTVAYGYDTVWKDKLVSYDGQNITYDELGNPLTYKGYTMTWQGKRLQALAGNGTTASYTYDEQGVRTSKTLNGITTAFSYNGSLLMAQVTGSGKQLYSYDANGQLVSINYNGTEYYYLRNGQNDVIGLMDGNGTRVVEYVYDSWGKLVSTTGTLATTLGANNPFRYRGYYYDTETGLYYLMTRYFDPEVGRFISADAFMSTGQGVVGGNMFAYCGNNPICRKEVEGTFFFTVIGAIVGGAIGGIFAAANGEDVVAGIAGGAVSGAIMGALTDITVATGGVAAPALAVVAVGIVSGGLGDVTTQVVTGVRSGHTLKESLSNLDGTSIAISAASGAIGAIAGDAAGKLITNVVFEPVKKAVVNNAIKYAANKTTQYISQPILKAATKAGVYQLASDTLISIAQQAIYNRVSSRIKALAY